MVDDELSTIEGDDPWTFESDDPDTEPDTAFGAGDDGGTEQPSGPPIRSMPTLIAGVVCIAIGLAAAIAELSGLTFDQSASITFLAGAVVVLAALVLQSRGRR